MAFTLNVHQRDKKNPSMFTKVKHYVRLSQRGSVPYFIQDGRVYTEDGAHVNDPPEWVLEQAESLSVQMKKTVKYEGQPKKRGRPTKKVEDNGDDQPDGSVD